MVNDIFTMLRKEWKELLQFQGSSRSGLIGLLIMIGIFAIAMPIQWGSMWVESGDSLTLWLVIPMMLAAMIVADSFQASAKGTRLKPCLRAACRIKPFCWGRSALQ